MIDRTAETQRRREEEGKRQKVKGKINFSLFFFTFAFKILRVSASPRFKFCDNIFSTMTDKVFTDNILQGKVAFVTGGGTGITGGIARALAEAGAKVSITSRKIENLEPMRELIAQNGGECLATACDVRQFATVENAIAQTVAHFGKIDIVVNGAAGNFLCAAEEL